MWYIYDIKFGMLEVRDNEISMRKCGAAHLHSIALMVFALVVHFH